MSFGIVLNESDLREMSPDLRDPLLKWYFARTPPRSDSTPVLGRGVTEITRAPQREESGRVSFPEFTHARLLAPGDRLVCRTLKRQQRHGEDLLIDAGKVLPDGRVEYGVQRYDTPSKLAVAVINKNGGKTEALNGYDYLLLRTPNGLVPLNELRDRYLRRIGAVQSTPNGSLDQSGGLD